MEGSVGREPSVCVERYRGLILGVLMHDTISDKPLPNTGGPPLWGLAAIALGLSVGGACVAGVRRRDR